jgi:hypothetical protein
LEQEQVRAGTGWSRNRLLEQERVNQERVGIGICGAGTVWIKNRMEQEQPSTVKERFRAILCVSQKQHILLVGQ